MKTGDHILVDRGSYAHHGIYAGRNRVIHYTGEPTNVKDAEIAETGLKEFLKGGVPIVVPHLEPFPPQIVLARARSRLGEKQYNLAFNNCESFASWAATGSARSYQVENILRGILKALGWI